MLHMIRFFLLTMVAATTVLGSMPAQAGPEIVSFVRDYPLGAIVVVNRERRLYYIVAKGRAVRYPVAVGTPENQWSGQSFVVAKAVNPTWTPPWNPGHTMPGGPGNPLGVRALYLGWTNYRIHGTNAPGSIGAPASHGCIRMFNADVTDLYERVHLGAPVYVVDVLPAAAAQAVLLPPSLRVQQKPEGKAAAL